VTALDAYDRLAPHYREYASARATYLDAVDRFVAHHARRGGSFLDVGAGDGVRAVALARSLAASRTVLCEPSAAMAALCRMQPVDAVWETPAQSLPASVERFDTITCLWNVLGHLPDGETRVAALAAMARLLAPGGALFFDVNNRHNARAYGRARVALRRVIDRIAPDERRGDTAFEWRIGGAVIPATGHLFTPSEAISLVHRAGLVPLRTVAVDYATGECSDALDAGQIMVQAGCPKGGGA